MINASAIFDPLAGLLVRYTRIAFPPPGQQAPPPGVLTPAVLRHHVVGVLRSLGVEQDVAHDIADRRARLEPSRLTLDIDGMVNDITAALRTPA